LLLTGELNFFIKILSNLIDIYPEIFYIRMNYSKYEDKEPVMTYTDY